MAQTDILEYLRKTPHNTNVNVVKTMLNAEGGGGGASGMIVNAVNHPDESSMYLDKTYTEIKTAISNGSPVYVRKEDDDYLADNYLAVTHIVHAVRDGQYSIMVGTDFQYNSETADDYPKYYYGD